MPISVIGHTRLPSEEDLRALEQELRAHLPDDYRAFLTKFNGGRPEPNWFPISGGMQMGAVNQFYGLRQAGDWDDLLTQQQYLLNRMPGHMLPIAHAACGNVVCLSLGDMDYGVVYHWDHEFEADEDEEPTYSNLLKVADSFSAFFGSIRQGLPPGV
jgi:hypothetical protein